MGTNQIKIQNYASSGLRQQNSKFKIPYGLAVALHSKGYANKIQELLGNGEISSSPAPCSLLLCFLCPSASHSLLKYSEYMLCEMYQWVCVASVFRNTDVAF
jgi:hypothetical protein